MTPDEDELTQWGHFKNKKSYQQDIQKRLYNQHKTLNKIKVEITPKVIA